MARSGLATVTTFGDDGWGTLQPIPPAEDPGRDIEPLAFHSTAIVDGSRTIAIGSRVRYRVVAGRGGRWEATDVEPIAAGSDEAAAPMAGRTPGSGGGATR